MLSGGNAGYESSSNKKLLLLHLHLHLRRANDILIRTCCHIVAATTFYYFDALYSHILFDVSVCLFATEAICIIMSSGIADCTRLYNICEIMSENVGWNYMFKK